jgi:hypothetical protein
MNIRNVCKPVQYLIVLQLNEQFQFINIYLFVYLMTFLVT